MRFRERFREPSRNDVTCEYFHEPSYTHPPKTTRPKFAEAGKVLPCA